MDDVAKALSAALDRLWKQFLPQIQDRVDRLRAVTQALDGRYLSHQQRTEAHAAAHRLAGALGTFGLAEGTLLAREAEKLLSADSALDPAAAARLSAIVEQLSALIAAR